MQRRAKSLVLTLAFVVAELTTLAVAPARAGDKQREGPTGGLIFLNHPALVVDRLDLTISPDEIKAAYSVRNSSPKPLTLVVTFPLPDIDAGAGNVHSMALAAPQSSNFVAASILADGVSVPLEIEQRALIAGLDAKPLLVATLLPIEPYVPRTVEFIARLPNAAKRMLVENGILRDEGDHSVPNWNLKSTAHWKQAFAPMRTTDISLSYRPLAASAKFSPELFANLKTSHCVELAKEIELTRRVSANRGDVRFRWLTYQLTSGSGLLTHPIGRYRLKVVVPSFDTLLLTCRKGLRRLGPTVYELIDDKFYPDDDLQLLFID